MVAGFGRFRLEDRARLADNRQWRLPPDFGLENTRMMSTRQQLESFYRFASEHAGLESGGISIDEIYAAWRSRHPEVEELRESLGALGEASAELDRGETGTSAEEVIADLYGRLGLVVDG
jgi:hypothetical protein